MPAPSDAPDSDTLQIADSLRATLGTLLRRLREQSEADELTGAQKAVLSRLDRSGPATVSALARAEAMKPQSMGTNVAALAALGLVVGRPDPSDGRQTLISITDHYREWVGAARRARRDWLGQAMQTHLSPEERSALGTAVVLLRRLVDG